MIESNMKRKINFLICCVISSNVLLLIVLFLLLSHSRSTAISEHLSSRNDQALIENTEISAVDDQRANDKNIEIVGSKNEKSVDFILFQFNW